MQTRATDDKIKVIQKHPKTQGPLDIYINRTNNHV